MTALPDSSTGSSSGAGPPSRRSRRRAVLWWLGRALIGVAALNAIAAVAVRIYLTDERLRRLAVAYVAERSGAPMEITGLEVSLFTGIELTGIRVGAMPGFTRDLLAIDRVALCWSLWELLRLRIVVREIALERPRLAVEQTDHGRNLDLFLAALSPPGHPDSEPPPSPPAPAASAPTAPPEISLPLRVEIHRIALVDLQVDSLAPGLAAHIDGIHIEGRFAGRGRALELDLWAGLGERYGGSSHIRLVRQKPALGLEADVRLGVHAVLQGLDDLMLTVDLASRTHVTQATAWPVVEATGRLRATADLVTWDARLDECAFRLGRATTATLQAAVDDLFTASGTARLAHGSVQVDLDELAPLIAAATPGVHTGGRLALTIAPFEATLTELAPRALPALTAALRLDDLRLQRAGFGIEGLSGRIGLTIARALAGLEGTLTAALVIAPELEARRPSVTLRATAPLAAVLGGEDAGEIEAQLGLEAHRLRTPAATAGDVQIAVDLATPAALLTAKRTETPLTAGLRLHVAALEAAGLSAARTHLALDARLWDLAGDHLDADIDLRVSGAATRFEGDIIEVPSVALTADLARRGEALTVEQFRLDVGDLAAIEAQGGVAGVSGPAPRVQELAVRASVPRLAEVLARLPARRRPAANVGGALRAELTVDGTFDRAELTALARPPAVSLAPGGTSWEEAVRAYVGFVDRWAARFARGLPGVAVLGLHVADLSFRDAANDVRGADADLALELGHHGPRADLALTVDAVYRPAAVRGARAAVAIDASAEGIEVRLDAGADEIDRSGHRALEKLAAVLRARYRLGGDLVLEELSVREARLGVRVAAAGILTRPLALVLDRGWERPGLPGMELGLRFALGFGKPGQTVMLAPDGSTAAGVIGVDGQLRIDRGLVALAGELAADGFSYVSGVAAVEEMSGKLPFDLRLVAGQREDAAIVARDTGFGGGVISLLAAGDDIRSRPARPAYYERLRSYRDQRGITIKALRQDPYEVLDLRLDSRIEQGMLLVDWLSMHVLGGDLVGNLALQLARDASVRGDMALQLSGIDASNFKLLELTPGPDSELNADLKLAFLFAPRQRDLTVNMNVTKIGAQTLDRFLQLLAAGSADDKLAETRRNLRWVQIDGVALWIRYENLNMDLAYSTRLRIPFTNIGYRPIDREMLRRYSLSGLLDTYLQPYLDAHLASSLGWIHAR